MVNHRRGGEHRRTKKQWQMKAGCIKFNQATVAASFQRTFPVCEAFRGSAWQLQGAGAMPAPYHLVRARIGREALRYLLATKS
jgi:hypothetical protein